jgi:hypothetical protein
LPNSDVFIRFMERWLWDKGVSRFCPNRRRESRSLLPRALWSGGFGFRRTGQRNPEPRTESLRATRAPQTTNHHRQPRLRDTPSRAAFPKYLPFFAKKEKGIFRLPYALPGRGAAAEGARAQQGRADIIFYSRAPPFGALRSRTRTTHWWPPPALCAPPCRGAKWGSGEPRRPPTTPRAYLCSVEAHLRFPDLLGIAGAAGFPSLVRGTPR